MRRVVIRVSVLLALTTGAGVALASLHGPPPSRTGAPSVGGVPAEGLCNQCHSGFAVNDPAGLLEILDLPGVYALGQTYPLRVRLSYAHPGGATPHWGFEITALATDGDGAGAFVLPDGAGSPGFEDSLLAIAGNGQFGARRYVTHSEFSAREGQLGPVEWRLDWVAPGSDVGPVGFFAAGNAANGNFGISGDRVFTAAVTVLGPSLTAAPGGAASTGPRLEAARPNPFATRTEIGFAIPRAGPVSLVIYDLLGRRVRTLVAGTRSSGAGRITWDGTDDGGAPAPNGTYFARLRVPGAAPVQRAMSLAR